MTVVTRACRNCVNKEVCRWFPEVPADFVVQDKKYKDAMQIALEILFAEHCRWYEQRKGEDEIAERL